MPRSSSSVETVSHYSRFTGWIYIFNLIVGTGALTLPAAFHDAGWLPSTVIIILLAFISYLTATFVIGKNYRLIKKKIHWPKNWPLIENLHFLLNYHETWSK